MRRLTAAGLLAWALASACPGGAKAEDAKVPAGSPSAERIASVPEDFAFFPEKMGDYGLSEKQYRALPLPEQQRIRVWVRVLRFEALLRDTKSILPSGAPPADRLAAVPKDFPFVQSDLKSYGYPGEYAALLPGEKQRVRDWVRILEFERLMREARDQAAKRQTDSGPPQTPRLMAQELDSLARLRAQTAFDGAGPPAARGGLPVIPSAEFLVVPPVDGSQGWGGGLRRLTLAVPGSNLVLEGGFLGLDGRSPLVSPSPYLNLYDRWRGSGSAADYDVRAQAGVVNLGARLYSDYGPIDSGIDSSVAGLQTLNPNLISPGAAASVGQSLAYSTNFESMPVFVGSLLGRVGRAWRLGDDGRGNHVDLGISGMGEARVTQFFPNGVLDQILGLRLHSASGQNLGFFGGVTEGLNLFSQTVISDSLNANKVQTDLHPEIAPHASVAAWGTMPYFSNAQYYLEAGSQWNPWTTVRQISGSVTAPVGQARVGVFGNYNRESGDAIGYDRQRAAAGVTVSPRPGLDLGLQYGQENFSYGTAAVENHSVLLTLTASETADKGQRGASVTLDVLFGGKDHLISPQYSSQLVTDAQRALSLIRQVKDGALNAAGGAASAWQDLQNAWSKLPPNAQALLNAAYHAANPNGPTLNQVLATKPSNWQTLNNLADFLSNTSVLDRVLVRYIRSQILDQLQSVQIPVIGNVRMSAPMVLAAAHAYSLSPSPMPALTGTDVLNGLNPYLLNQASGQFGCASGSQPQATTNCILGALPSGVGNDLKNRYGSAINDVLTTAVTWPSSVIQRDVDAMLLQVILAAETLNQMTVDQGQKIGDLNVRGMLASFEYLDERERKLNTQVFTFAKEEVAQDLKADDERLRAMLTAWGSQRLAWLQHQAAWPKNVTVQVADADWAPLIAVHTDAKIFDIILTAKGALARKPGDHTLILKLDRVSALHGISITRGVGSDPTVIALPPQPLDLSLFDFSDL